MSRFFVPQDCIKDNIAYVSAAEAHHILDVLRLRQGDNVQFFDGTGKLYKGRILASPAKTVRVEIKDMQELPPANVEITLVQSLPKSNKMDYIVEKTTELGVDVIIPTQTARTVIRLERPRQLQRQIRWQKLAREAAKQCGQLRIPQVKNLTSWKEILSTLDDFDLKLLPCLTEKTQTIKSALSLQKKRRKIIFFIGPEGDFTDEEIEQACSCGCLAVSLGSNVLKCDTAAVAVLAMLNYALS